MGQRWNSRYLGWMAVSCLGCFALGSFFTMHWNLNRLAVNSVLGAKPTAESQVQPQMTGSPEIAAEAIEELSALPAANPTVLPQPRHAMMAPAYKSVKIEKVPFVRQKPDFCGEACAAMMLRRLGQNVDQDYVYDQSGLDPKLGRGCYTRELADALVNIGFKTGPVWHKVPVRAAATELESLWASVHADLLQGHGSILCTHFDDRPNTTEHFRLILGYDAERDEVLYHDPALDRGEYLRMSRTMLMALWPLKYAADEWTIIRMALVPDKLQQGSIAKKFTSADYAQHVLKLKETLPSQDFHIVIQPPFVVIGDDPAKVVQRRADNTVRWAAERLRAELFDRDPEQILDIWLFKDDESYRTHAKQLFGAEPGTPYGYYSPSHGALVMNISTGGGTLVHEIVHPFVATDFPRCPSWLNEGLGSLYEQCGDHEGRIWGYTNWRLAGLQQAIKAKRVPAFETLCSTTRDGFYNEDPGTNYSQARYLCYYLQEHGLLVKFYRQFRSDWQEDPSGFETLKKVLKAEDMVAFQAEWEEYVAELKFE